MRTEPLCSAHSHPPYFTPCSSACDVLGCWYEREIGEAVDRMNNRVGNALHDLSETISRALDQFQIDLANAMETALGLGGDDSPAERNDSSG